MTRILTRGLLIAAAAFTSISASAATEKPGILTVPALYGGSLNSMSANGKWAVGHAVNPENSSFYAYPRLVDAETGTCTELFTEQEGLNSAAISASSVSNDGCTVGGSYGGRPAVWTKAGGWQILPLPKGAYNMGAVSAITPDGRYAAGKASIDLFREYPCLWDLAELKLVELPGMVASNPRYLDMIDHGGDPAEWSDADLNVRLNGISADGNFLLGCVDFIYPDAMWQFVYDRSKQSWSPLGMKYEGGRLRPLAADILTADECVFSCDGKLIGGTYISTSDGKVPFTCPSADPTAFTTYADGDGYGVWAIGCDGVPYGSAPVSTPVRNWSARAGKYWYDWKQTLRQVYGIDWLTDITKDELGLSGSAVAVSDDNKRILAVDFAQNISYILTLPAPMAEICTGVDLLADFSIYPPAGAQFSTLQTVTLDFDREIEVACDKTAVTLTDSEGNALRASINVATQAGNRQRLEVIFRNYALEPEKDYTVSIPAGAICIAGDPEQANKPISIPYRGREAGAVRPVAISPANGSDVARINLTTNPVTVGFNAIVTPAEGASVGLWQIKEGEEEFLFPLNATVDGSNLIIYPLGEQTLAKGTDYRIDVAAGSLTDLSGAGPNEAFSISYHGAYTPEIDPSSNIVYSNDFSMGVGGMLLFEGDGNSPAEEMALWGFDAENTPWMPVLDDDDTEGNYAAAAHSSFDPAGQAEDWMVTPQLFLPDDKARLTFKSQSHKNGKTDMLKVYVWESADVITVLTRSTADKIHYNGDLVYNQRQLPGAKEDVLAGDWTLNSVDLSRYAGKYIYVAFLNDNRNQSAVFVDDILISRETAALLSVATETTAVDADATAIRGRFLAAKEGGLHGYDLTLTDSEGNVLEHQPADAFVAKGESVEFTFAPVTLEKGAVNSFSVILAAEGETLTYPIDIRNLLFKTTKRTTVEEYTGTGCQFCPQGILAAEHLLEVFGDAVIPIAIHSYTGDKMGGAEQTAYSDFLGLNAAPSASVGRGPASNAMWCDGADYHFLAPDGNTWLEHTQRSLSELPLADIAISEASADADSNTVGADFTVTFALDLPKANINIFGVVLEDGVVGYQTNGLYNTEAPGLGEWGKGGIYGKATVRWTYDDVVRGTSVVEAAGRYSGFNGRGGYIPASVKGGDAISSSFSFTLPSGISDINRLKLCLMLIDANNGEFINAALSPCAAASVSTPGAESPVKADVYDLTGRLVMRGATAQQMSELPAGVYIRAGKKYLKMN